MKIDTLEWDDNNVEHISHHNISLAEVEQACLKTHLIVRSKYHRYLVYGQTDSGRYVKIVLQTLYGRVFRPITAWEMSENEKRNYRKKLH